MYNPFKNTYKIVESSNLDGKNITMWRFVIFLLSFCQ